MRKNTGKVREFCQSLKVGTMYVDGVKRITYVTAEYTQI